MSSKSPASASSSPASTSTSTSTSSTSTQSWINSLPANPDMSKRSMWTQCTPLPPNASPIASLDLLRDHSSMITLNPLLVRYEPSTPPPNCSEEELDAVWYEITDKLTYLPKVGIGKGEVTYKMCFRDLPQALSTHVYAPAGLDIAARWSIEGATSHVEKGHSEKISLRAAGAPSHGLYVREDVDMRCNVFLTNYCKRNLKKAHATLAERLIAKIEDTTISENKEVTALPAGDISTHAPIPSFRSH